MSNPIQGEKRIITRLYPFPYRKFGQIVQGEMRIEQEYRIYKKVGLLTGGSPVEDGGWVDIRIVEE